VLQLFAHPFYVMICRVWTYTAELKEAISRKQDGLSETNKAHARETLKLVAEFGERFKMTRTLGCVYGAMNHVAAASPEKMLWVMEHLEVEVKLDFTDMTLMHFPSERVEYFDEWRKNRKLGGLFDGDEPSVPKRVSTRFPEAIPAIAGAGTSYAVEDFDGCVFHLLRVLEYGLRKLARQLSVPCTMKKGSLELQTWGFVINQIEEAVKKMPTAKTTREAKKLEYFNHAASQFSFVKDAWRDVFFHSRNGEVQDAKVKHFMENVREFMKIMARGV